MCFELILSSNTKVLFKFCYTIYWGWSHWLIIKHSTHQYRKLLYADFLMLHLGKKILIVKSIKLITLNPYKKFFTNRNKKNSLIDSSLNW